MEAVMPDATCELTGPNVVVFEDGSCVAHLPDNWCQEDEPCWDCHTMGNKICGTPTTAARATHAVVAAAPKTSHTAELPHTGTAVVPMLFVGVSLISVGRLLRRWSRKNYVHI
jgi:hypothetical protein